MDEQQLVCRFCGKTVKSKSGLTNHEKICSKAPNNQKESNMHMATSSNPYDHDLDERDVRDACDDEPGQERKTKSPKANPFNFMGAFVMMPDYIPMFLDVDFCVALGNHILEHGSPNSAIMAFAHQLNKLDGD